MSDTQRTTVETRLYRTVLAQETESALQEMDRPVTGLLLSGVSAGLNVSFGALFMGMALTFTGGFESELLGRVVLGSVSAVGFVVVILGQTELFTAHTAMGLLPVLDDQASARDLGTFWATVYVANLVGCALSAATIAVVGPPLGIVAPRAFATLAGTLLPFTGPTMLASGAIAGWLVALVTWLVAVSRDTSGAFLVTLVVTAAIGFGPFHHCLLGTTEVLAAMFLGQGVTPLEYVDFLAWSTAGNLIGGAVFVALLNYGQAVRGGMPQDASIDPPGE